MAKIDITTIKDEDLSKLVENRWSSSDELWDIVKRIYKSNTDIYANQADWLAQIPYVRQNWTVQANRIFVNMEAVINSLIANPPGINILPGREGEEVQDFARGLEKYMKKKLTDRNIKETSRKALRNLYFGRLYVVKAFWNPVIDDFDFRAIDPRNVRFGKYSTKEQDSEFAIEEIEDNLCAVVERFPDKKAELMKKFGFPDGPEGEAQLYIRNPDVKYKEAWIMDHVVFKLDNIILGKIRNPYWDWDGILISADEEQQLSQLTGQARRDLLTNIKLDQGSRKAQQAAIAAATPVEATMLPQAPEQSEQETAAADAGELEPPAEGATPGQQPAPAQEAVPQYHPYRFNYFESPRKPYIFATAFNNENTPIGRTDMIQLASTLQRGIDKRKMDIDENCEMANGILKVDAKVMGKSDAQRIRFQTKGIVWGTGVKDGVTRETGAALPAMVFQDMVDSRQEIDSIMAASSAFRGEREGQETKAGRLALIQQSYLRLNELVQVVDYTYGEIYGWSMQLAKSRYTEYRESKWLGDEGAQEVMELIQDDFEPGQEVVVIPGKTLPVDDEFKFEQAQNDVKGGIISPVDYLKIAQYDDPKDLAKNAVMYHLSPVAAVGLTQEELAKIPPPLPTASLKESVAFDDLPAEAKSQVLSRMGITVDAQTIVAEGHVGAVAIAFKDLPLDGQIQAAAMAGIQLDPAVAMAEKAAEAAKGRADQGHQLAMKAATAPPAKPGPLPANQ